MRILLLGLSLSFVFAVARSPEERTVTDPATVVSQKNANARPIPIEDLFYSKGLSNAAWSPDGSEIVFVTNLTGRYNLWKVSSAGGWPVQLAVSDEQQRSPAWSPDGKTIVWTEDRGGNEYADLYAMPADGGEPAALTATPDVSETDPMFAPDGKRLAIGLHSKSAPAVDVALFDLASRTTRNLTNEKTPDHVWSTVAWSDDGKFLIANRANIGFTDGDVYRIDAVSGALENLTPHTKATAIAASSLSPDGKTVLLTSNEKGGFNNAALLDVASKKLRWITDLHWEVDTRDISPDGKWLTYVVDADGQQNAYIAAADGTGARALPLPEGFNFFAGRPSAFSSKSDRVLVEHQSATQPADWWTVDVATGRTARVTRTSVAALESAALPPSQIVHYKSFDGTMISALLWMPFNLERNGRNPAIVYPHGGPTSQFVDSFSRTVAALVSRGYIVIAPNVRGSTGYGMAFQKMNVKDLGGGDLQDEVYATKFLVATGYADPKKIGITGGSYGGYMTLMAIGKTPEVWAAAVEQYGIVDWLTMLQHEDPLLQSYEKSLLGDPVKDRATYEAASPIKYLRNAKAPLLVLQGENDIRVPKEEAEQVVKLLKEAGATVDAHVYAHEGHGFYRR
ncbi:MAG TPA: S9 family peptidase, partial [Thermoanaerobaculia bacterium]|nr:S9 family peptidase [Thermoanaerobaculia bacterium]